MNNKIKRVPPPNNHLHTFCGRMSELSHPPRQLLLDQQRDDFVNQLLDICRNVQNVIDSIHPLDLAQFNTIFHIVDCML